MRHVHSIVLGSFLLIPLASCADISSEAAEAAAAIEAEELTQIATPVDATEERIEAPPGEFNLFSVIANYETASCQLSKSVYDILGPSGVSFEDCPDCLLPSQIQLADPPEGFDTFVCREETQGCDLDSDTSGITLQSLAFPMPLCGEEVPPTHFLIVFGHLNTTEAEAPRVWVRVSAELRLDARGLLEPAGNWTRCIETEEGERCTTEDGTYEGL